MQASLADIRAKFPQYEDLSDKQLANGLHAKYYSDLDQADFYQRIGFDVSSPDALDIVDGGDGFPASTPASAGQSRSILDRVEGGLMDVATSSERAAPGPLADGLVKGVSAVAASGIGAVRRPEQALIEGVRATVTAPGRAAEGYTEGIYDLMEGDLRGAGQNALKMTEAGLETALAVGAPGGAVIQRAVRPQTPVNETAEIFRRSNIDPSIASAVDSEGLRAGVKRVAENEIAGRGVRRNLNQALDQGEAQLNRLGDRYGGVEDTADAGGIVTAAALRLRNERAGRLYERAFGSIDETAQVHLPNTLAATKAYKERFSNDMLRQRMTPEIANFFDRLLAGELREVRSGGSSLSVTTERVRTTPSGSRPYGGTEDVINQTGGVTRRQFEDTRPKRRDRSGREVIDERGNSISFDELRAVRTWVRQQQKANPDLKSDNDRFLEGLEASLTRDMYEAVSETSGQQALAYLQSADKMYRQSRERLFSALKPFLKTENGRVVEAEPEVAFASIRQAMRGQTSRTGTGSVRRLREMRRILTREELDQVAGGVLKNMGKMKEGDPFSINSFVTEWRSYGEAQKSIVFGDKTKPLRQSLDDFTEAAERLKSIEDMANASRSGAAIQNTFTAFLGATNPVAGAVYVGSQALAGRLLTNPKYIDPFTSIMNAEYRAARLSAMGQDARARVVRDSARRRAILSIGAIEATTPEDRQQQEMAIRLLEQPED